MSRQFTRFNYRFHSPQVKVNLISSTIAVIYKFPSYFPNDLRPNFRPVFPCGNKIFDASAKKTRKNTLLHF